MNFRFVNANGLPFFLQKQHLLSYFFLTKNNLNQITLKKSMKKDWTREELETDIIGKMKAVTIPVNISFKGKQKILDMSELGEILRNAKVISKGRHGRTRDIRLSVPSNLFDKVDAILIESLNL